VRAAARPKKKKSGGSPLPARRSTRIASSSGQLSHTAIDTDIPETSTTTRTGSDVRGGSKRLSLHQRQRHGKAIAFATSEEYDVDVLRERLWALGLLGRADGSNAVNLMSEAIWLPRWPLLPDDGDHSSPSSASSSSSETSTSMSSHSSDHSSPPSSSTLKEIEDDEYFDGSGSGDSKKPQQGEVFVFENGSYVTWGLEEDVAEMFLTKVIRGNVAQGGAGEPVEKGRYKEEQSEAIDYLIDLEAYVSAVQTLLPKLNMVGLVSRTTHVAGDTIIIGKARPATAERNSNNSNSNENTPDGANTAVEDPASLSTETFPAVALSTNLPSSMADVQARLSLSYGLTRSTKLAVYEESMDSFLEA
jgi:uncharacterized Rmd1/YagE family protein